MLTDRVLQFFVRLRDFFQREKAARPKPVQRICYACREPILEEPIFWEGKPFCAYSCVPAIRRHNREADLLKRARQGGV